jgi:hypothetical protein
VTDVTIEIEVTERDPPVGQVRLEDGRAIDFTGWLGLMGALTEAFRS